MVKIMLFITSLGNGFIWGEIVYFVQIIPSKTNNPDTTLQAYLISAIVALVGTISFLFVYSKSLNKIIKATSESHAKQLQEIYQTQISDYKEVTARNTEAHLINAQASREVAESNKLSNEALTSLRVELVRIFGLKNSR